MFKLLWMTVDRHPESLKNLIRERMAQTGWEVFEVSYDHIQAIESIPLEDIHAVLLAPARHFPSRYMERLKNCKLMQIWSSGYDKFNIDDAHGCGITVANNHGSNALSVAEHAILMMLGVARRAPEMHNRVLTGNWAGNDHGMNSYGLGGKALGIVGMGKIGSLVASRAEAFGMKILFTDPVEQENLPESWKKVSFETLLNQSDVVTFHVHLNDQTRSMISTKNLHLLSRRPFLVNVSRAEIVEREALLQALQGGLIRGAALDVHYEEPTNSSDQLLSHGNLFLSPHIAGSTIDSYEATIEACLGNIAQGLEAGIVRGIIPPKPTS